MSPRAAWRLEAAGFNPVYDYVNGKSDWLAADLPFDGNAQLVGAFIRRQVATVSSTETVQGALDRLDAVGFGPVIAVNDAGVVMGSLTRDAMTQAHPGAPVASVWGFGVTTVRPSEQVAPLLQRMDDANVTRIVVSRSDGTLVGIFVASDVRVEHHHHGGES